MKKLFAVLVMAVMASSAFGQQALPGGKRKVPDVINTVNETVTIPIAQVQQCDPPTLGTKDTMGTNLLPPGVTPANWCFVGDTMNFAFPACRIDTGKDGSFDTWLPILQDRCAKDPKTGEPTEDVVIQGVKMRKIEPMVPKCPDIYPGIDFIQTGNSGIRTFWALKFTPCNTIFRLSIEFACVTRTVPRVVHTVHVLNFEYKVVIKPSTLRFVIEALHCQPLGACEVPCITDEGLFKRLLGQADDIESAAKGTLTSNGAFADLNDALDRFEATLVHYAMFTTAAWQIVTIKGVDTLIPCTLFGGVEPGNKTIDKFGFGIVDTCEHPCVCKLIADLVCLKNDFIGTDP